MKKQRKRYSPEDGLQPTVFYRWQKEFFENGAAAFEPTDHPTTPPSRSGLHTCRKRSRRRTRFWPS